MYHISINSYEEKSTSKKKKRKINNVKVYKQYIIKAILILFSDSCKSFFNLFSRQNKEPSFS